MSNSDIFSIVGSALDAQNARMGAIASNLANVDSIAPPGGEPYRAHEVVFEAAPVAAGETDGFGDGPSETAAPDLGVSVAGTVQSNAAPVQTYDPGSPDADAKGYVTGSNVSQVNEMVNLIDSSNSYSAAVRRAAASQPDRPADACQFSGVRMTNPRRSKLRQRRRIPPPRWPPPPPPARPPPAPVPRASSPSRIFSSCSRRS